MKISRIVNAVGHIDDELIEAAEENAKANRKNSWFKYGIIAACLTLAVVAAGIMIPFFKEKDTNQVFFGDLSRNYKKVNISGSETAIVWPWEYKTIYEQYTSITFEGQEYTTRAREIDPKLLGKIIGNYEAKGYDTYTEKEYRKTVEVRQIKDVSDEYLIAVNLDGAFYVFIKNKYDPPATLGELSDVYGLPQTLKFSTLSAFKGYDETGHYRLNNDDYIWGVLSECRDAAFIEDYSFTLAYRNYISFTATSDALGTYKRVLYVTEDGYLSTNIFDYAYIYNIGKTAAEKIIDCVKDNAEKCESAPYNYSLAGTIVEIGDGYILVDDSVMCVNQKDGMVFKVSTKDLRISRCIDFLNYKTGDTVIIEFSGKIDAAAGNLVIGAYSMRKAKITDGNVWVAE